jgi:hypothetical protein
VEPKCFLVEKDFAFNLAGAFDPSLSKAWEEKQQIERRCDRLIRSDR